MKLTEILKSLGDLKADYISLREVKTKVLTMAVRDENFEGLNTSEDHGLMIEVMMNGQFAYSATNSFELSEIRKCAIQAQASAVEASRFSLSKFSESERPVTKGEYKSPVLLKALHL